jgi:hypothetical protein
MAISSLLVDGASGVERQAERSCPQLAKGSVDEAAARV